MEDASASIDGSVDSGHLDTEDGAAHDGDAARIVCTYPGAPLVALDAASTGPWITGTEVPVSGLARDPEGNVFLIGGSLLAKFDPNGVRLWAKAFGAPNNGVYPQGIAADPVGSVVMVGTTQKANVTADFGGGPLPAGGFIVKYDRDGNLLFQKMFPLADNGASFPWMSDVRILRSGDIVVAGSLQGTIDFGGGPLTAAGGISVFLARFGPCGSYLFARQYGVTANNWSWSRGLAANDAGDLLITGIFTGTLAFAGGIVAPLSDYDSFVAKFNALGDPIAGRDFHTGDPRGGPGEPALDDTGQAIVLGSFSQPIDLGGGAMDAGSAGGYVAAYGPNLEYLWALAYSDPAFLSLAAAVIDGARNVVVTGALSGSGTLGKFALDSIDGGGEMLVARLALDGGVLSATAGSGASTGTVLQPADGTNVLLGGMINYSAFSYGAQSLPSGPRGMVMHFAP
jgi:hypothetical protein